VVVDSLHPRKLSWNHENQEQADGCINTPVHPGSECTGYFHYANSSQVFESMQRQLMPALGNKESIRRPVQKQGAQASRL